MKPFSECRECGSENLYWFSDVENVGHAVNGRLRISEVRPIMILACENCSETNHIVTGDDVAAFLNSLDEKTTGRAPGVLVTDPPSTSKGER